MHSYYDYTIDVCNQAEKAFTDEAHRIRREMRKQEGESSEESVQPNIDLLEHNCHRHWAYALFKRSEMGKALKQIKKAVQINEKEPENWLVWGLILRKVGQYKSAQHKFNMALKLDPGNITAKQELLLLQKIEELDS